MIIDMPTLVNPTGIFVVRVWIDQGRPEGGFRARILQTVDIHSSHEVERTVSTPESIYEALSRWLEAFLENGRFAR